MFAALLAGGCASDSRRPGSCTSDGVCAPTTPYCVAGRCVAPCTESEIGVFECRARRPIECELSRNCMICPQICGQAEWCTNVGCQPRPAGGFCSSDADCASGRCDVDAGECAAGRDLGEACLEDEECGSDYCHFLDSVCAEKVANGAPCRFDSECASNNCGTDGFPERAGVCNLRLGSPCAQGEPLCSYCMGASSLFGGFCNRASCDPVNAPSCPDDWACIPTDEGGHGCFQPCESVGSPCVGSTLCLNGYCQ
ncbi:MAG: hypothetical protein AB8I08_10770 [Sandaracinaceae bacterium]